MREKSVWKISGELLAGIILMVPMFLFEKKAINGTGWFVVLRVFFSVGFSLAIAKGISFIYRIIFAFFAGTLIAHRPLYIGIYVFLIALGASSYFFLPGMTEKGYMWLEIVAYILGVIWFITDINTTKCASIINIWENKLGDVLCSHKNYVQEFKQERDAIEKRKKIVIGELGQYVKESFWNNPLKELKKTIDISYVDNYLMAIPQFSANIKGIDGLLFGNIEVYQYVYGINKYIDRLVEDEQYMAQEQKVYDELVEKFEKEIETAQKSEQYVKIVTELCESGEYANVDRWQNIRQNDIDYVSQTVKNSKEAIKKFRKVNKNANSIFRRMFYGK